jgi:3-hydroxyisobutyrate dehydrogenase-like beta-hydroxyacid dehydrogenase
VNPIMIAGTYACLGEGLALGEREGLPLEALVEALSGGAARSWVLENRSANVISSSYPLGFKTGLHLKDLRIALDQAAAGGLDLAVTRLVADQEQRLVEAGFGDEDVSNLARVARGEVSPAR